MDAAERLIDEGRIERVLEAATEPEGARVRAALERARAEGAFSDPELDLAGLAVAYESARGFAGLAGTDLSASDPARVRQDLGRIVAAADKMPEELWDKTIAVNLKGVRLTPAFRLPGELASAQKLLDAGKYGAALAEIESLLYQN